MEVKDIVPFVLLIVLCGMLLGTGIMVIDRFSRNVRDTTTLTDSGVNLSVSGTKTLSKTYCLSIVSIDNVTSTWGLTTYNVSLSSPDTCVMTYSAIAACSKAPKCNVTFTYGASNAAVVATTNTVSAISPIATTWIGLIVTVAILSIILGLVINSFVPGRK